MGALGECLEQLLFGAELYVARVVDVCLVAQVVVLHIVELIEHPRVEHVGEHVLLADQPIVSHFRQLALGVDPPITVVAQPYPLVPHQFATH